MAKSSMQELIDWLDPSFSSVIEKAKDLLEKEKQQIIDAFDAGVSFQNNSWKYSIPELDNQRKDYFNKHP